MDPMTAISLGQSVLGLLNGGGSGPDYSAANSSVFRGLNDGESIKNNAQSSSNDFNSLYNPGYKSAFGDYADYLQADPNTDQFDQAQLSRATQGTAAAYSQARAHLASSLAQRGLQTTDSADPSSALAGGLAGIENSTAATYSAASQKIAEDAIAQKRQNLANLVALYGSAADTAYNRAQSGFQADAGIQSDAAAKQMAMANSQYGDQEAQNQNFNNNFGTVGGLLGFGLSGALRRRSANPLLMSGGSLPGDPVNSNQANLS